MTVETSPISETTKQTKRLTAKQGEKPQREEPTEKRWTPQENWFFHLYDDPTTAELYWRAQECVMAVADLSAILGHVDTRTLIENGYDNVLLRYSKVVQLFAVNAAALLDELKQQMEDLDEGRKAVPPPPPARPNVIRMKKAK